MQTITKGLQEFINPYKQKILMKEISIQMQEIEGKLEFNKALYHNQSYENLIKFLVKSRTQFRSLVNISERKKIATSELAQWKVYIEARKKVLPQDFLITDRMKKQIKETWDMVKDRKDNDMKTDKLLEFHYEYAQHYRFDIPLDPRCLVQMVHPHLGYLTYMPGYLSLESLMQIYHNKLVASFERSLGQDLLANEICSYTYWQLFDKGNLGYMNAKQFTEFLKIFRFSLKPYITDIKKEFKFGLTLFPGEFSRDIEEKDDIVRFDFFRYIFLERNL